MRGGELAFFFAFSSSSSFNHVLFVETADGGHHLRRRVRSQKTVAAVQEGRRGKEESMGRRRL